MQWKQQLNFDLTFPSIKYANRVDWSIEYRQTKFNISTYNFDLNPVQCGLIYKQTVHIEQLLWSSWCQSNHWLLVCELLFEKKKKHFPTLFQVTCFGMRFCFISNANRLNYEGVELTGIKKKYFTEMLKREPLFFGIR